MNLENTTLLVLGHGSSKHPDSSQSVRMHTDELRAKGEFSQVHCAFLKEEPLIEDALTKIDTENVCIVPDFLAEGYFTRQVIPAKLALEKKNKRIRYTPPVGAHPMMAELIQYAAEEVLKDWQPNNTSLLVIGHGSGKNPCSKQTLKQHLHEVRENSSWSQVEDLWLEERPKVDEWSQLASKQQVIILPFLLNDGQHGGWDIPAELGVAEGSKIHGITHELHGHHVRLAPALGTSARFADVIAVMAQIWSQKS